MNIWQKSLAAITATLLTATIPAYAQPGAPAFMPSGEVADAPFGFTEMCARDATLCRLGETKDPAVRPGQPKAIHAAFFAVENPPLASDRTMLDMVKAINHQVNRAVVQVSDLNALGVDEHWNRLSQDTHPVGDCEDIAIEKRIRLQEAGFPANRLFYAVTFIPRLGLHTVLIARLNEGDYVLDSMSPHVLPWNQVHYVWLRQQVPGHPLEWLRVGGTA